MTEGALPLKLPQMLRRFREAAKEPAQKAAKGAGDGTEAAARWIPVSVDEQHVEISS